MMDSYLWDRTGPTDVEVEQLERLLSPFRWRHDRVIDVPMQEPTRKEPGSKRLWLAASAALLAAAMVIVLMGERPGAENKGGVPPLEVSSPPRPSSVATPHDEPARTEAVQNGSLLPTPGAPPGGTTGSRSLPDAVSGNAGATQSDHAPRKSRTAKPAASTLSDKLTAEEIKAVLGPLAAPVKACGKKHNAEPGSSIQVKLTVQGATGEVSAVYISPPHGGTPLGGCVEGVVREAVFPIFARPQLAIVFPFKL